MQDEEKESLLDGGQKRSVSERASLFNIIILSVGMLFVFATFNTVQNYMTTLKSDPNVGTLSLGILYIVFALSNLGSPLIVGKLGLKWSLVGGSVTYVIFVLSCIAESPIYLYIAAGVIGLGAAVLWTAHGAFLTASTTEANRGRLVGLFWGIFWGNAILGSLGGGVIFSLKLSNYVFYLVCVGVGAFGVLLLLLLRPVGAGGKTDAQVPPSLVGVVLMFIDRPYLPLHLLVAYSALSESYFYGVVTFNVGRSHWGVPFVGYVMTAAGVAEFLGSLAAGRMSDRIGRRPVFLVSVALQAVSMFLGWWAGPIEGKYNFDPYAFFLAAFVFGLADAGLVTMLYSTIGTMYTTRSKEAFATFKLVQSIAMGAAFLYAVKLELVANTGHTANVLIIAGFLVVGTAVGTLSFPTRAQMDALTTTTKAKEDPRAVGDGFATRLDSRLDSGVQ